MSPVSLHRMYNTRLIEFLKSVIFNRWDLTANGSYSTDKIQCSLHLSIQPKYPTERIQPVVICIVSDLWYYCTQHLTYTSNVSPAQVVTILWEPGAITLTNRWFQPMNNCTCRIFNRKYTTGNQLIQVINLNRLQLAWCTLIDTILYSLPCPSNISPVQVVTILSGSGAITLTKIELIVNCISILYNGWYQFNGKYLTDRIQPVVT